MVVTIYSQMLLAFRKHFVLYNVFATTADLSMNGSYTENTDTWMNTIHEDRYVAVVEKHVLDGANAIILMKRKPRYVLLVKSTSMDDTITVVVI